MGDEYSDEFKISVKAAPSKELRHTKYFTKLQKMSYR